MSYQNCRRIAAACGLALSLCASGCGRSGAMPDVDSSAKLQQRPQLSAALPSIPALLDLAAEQHEASFLSENSIDVTTPFLRSPDQPSDIIFVGTDRAGQWLRSDDEEASFDWAIYELTAGSFSTPIEVEGTFFTVGDGNVPDPDSVDQFFVGLADFEQERWVFADPQGSADTSPVTSILPVTTAARQTGTGSAFYVVIAPSGGNVALELSSLKYREELNSVPQADLQADVTSGDIPLTVNFDASGSTDSDGTIVQYLWSLDGDFIFEQDTGTDPHNSLTITNGGLHKINLRVVDNGGATGTRSITITAKVNGNIPPIPKLTSNVTQGEAGPSFVVNYFSTASDDLDGSIVLYEWDIDGNAANGFELNSATPDQQSFTYDQPGEINARLRVTDDLGLKATDSLTIHPHGWASTVVDTVANASFAGSFSLSMVGKSPGISYVDNDTGHAMFARSSSKFGTQAADWTVTELNNLATTAPTSLALVAQRPAMAFTSGLGGDMLFARSSTATGADPADWVPFKINTNTSAGASLAIIDGKPAVSCIDQETNQLLYLSSSTAEGATFDVWSVNTVEDLTVTALRTSLASIEGNPAIAWYDSATGGGLALNYARSSTVNGANQADWQQLEVTSVGPGTIDGGLELLAAAGHPVISFASFGSDGPGFAFSSSALGLQASDWDSLDLEPATGAVHPALALVDGLPRMLFDRRTGAQELHLASSLTADGSELADWSTQNASAGHTLNLNSLDSDLAEVNGYPAVVFFDSATSEVIYAVLF